MLSPKIFVFMGAILILSGVAQVFVRPRKPKETALQKVVNRATIQMLVFVAAGVFGLLIGFGVLPLPAGR